MKNILIVEDEKYSRLGLRKMISECGVEVGTIYDCRNGEEALEILRTQPFDVVFTDIKMPVMDGIELIRRMREEGMEACIVVISGFGDFNYAVEALRNGALDYLLKPVKRERIAEVLRKIQAQLEESRKAESFAGLGYFLLNESFRGAGEARIPAAIKKVFDGTEKTVICCVGKLELPPVFTCKDFVNGFTVILCDAAQGGTAMQKYFTKHAAGKSAGFTYANQLLPGYFQALENAKYAFIQRPQPEPAPVQGGHTQPEYSGRADIERCIQKIPTSSYTDCIGLVTGFFSSQNLHKISIESYESFLTQFLSALKYNFQSELEQLQANFDEQGLYDTSVPFMRERLCEAIAGLNALFSQDEMDWKNKEKILKAIAFINENYTKDINMAEVANRMELNYSNFSTAFKKFTGETFTVYLRRIRIEKAKELLLGSTDKIFEISTKVGYGQDRQFMKVFKTVVGVSPSQYRNQMIMKKYAALPAQKGAEDGTEHG